MIVIGKHFSFLVFLPGGTRRRRAGRQLRYVYSPDCGRRDLAPAEHHLLNLDHLSLSQHFERGKVAAAAGGVGLIYIQPGWASPMILASRFSGVIGFFVQPDTLL